MDADIEPNPVSSPQAGATQPRTAGIVHHKKILSLVFLRVPLWLRVYKDRR
jgi:hypothetical protein